MKLALIGGVPEAQLVAALGRTKTPTLRFVNEAVRGQRGEEMKQKTGLMPKLVNDFRELLGDGSIEVVQESWHRVFGGYWSCGCERGEESFVYMCWQGVSQSAEERLDIRDGGGVSGVV